MTTSFDPTNVDLDTTDPVEIICYLTAGGNEYDGRLGARISALFVILIVSTAATVFPVMAARVKWFRIPLYVYLFVRYFGAGVIIATAFIHLLDPAYDEIGPQTCVGMTGRWANYSWVPAIAMTSVMCIFLLDFAAEWYVESKYGFENVHGDVEGIVATMAPTDQAHSAGVTERCDRPPTQDIECGDHVRPVSIPYKGTESTLDLEGIEKLSGTSVKTKQAFQEQVAAFLILEFGVIFHSVIIGLNLGVVGAEFATLYPVIVFHQAFEGLGIGARLSVIPFPDRLRWMPWVLCLAYGFTTPIAISVGLGLSHSYNSGSFTANIVSGIFDSISAGILLYTGLVELLARDFLFNPNRTRDRMRIIFMLGCLFLGTAVMALLGKWA